MIAAVNDQMLCIDVQYITLPYPRSFTCPPGDIYDFFGNIRNYSKYFAHTSMWSKMKNAYSYTTIL
jgi:hypothetical protein